MRYFLIVLPWGGYVQVAAQSDEQALSIARQRYQGQYGATDLQGMSIAQPGGANQPYSTTTAPLLNPPPGTTQPTQPTQTPPAQTQPTQPTSSAPGTGITPGEQGDLSFALPQAAYRAGLKARGISAPGRLRGLLENQFAGTEANFSLGNLLNRAPGDTSEPEFQKYVQDTGPNAYRTARNLYNQVQGGGALPTEDMRSALYGAGLNDTPEQRALQSKYMTVARNAAQSYYSPFSARFLPSASTVADRLGDEYYRQEQTGNPQGVNLADFMKKLFGF